MTDYEQYEKPSANLIQDASPHIDTDQIKASELRLAGWLAIVFAIVSLPIFTASLLSGVVEHVWLNRVLDISTIVTTGLWVYLLLIIKRWVRARFQVSQLEPHITLLIATSLLVCILPFFTDVAEDTDQLSHATILYFILFIPYGVLTLIIGRKLLGIEAYFPYLKGFAWTLILSGFCMATVVLILFAVPIEIVSDILLALLFFKARDELESQQARDAEQKFALK